MSVIRAFIAVDLSPEIRQSLDDVMAGFRRQLGEVAVRWVPAGNVHLTLKFLGDVSVANIEMLTKLLQAEVAGRRPFEISVGGAGAFPNLRRPRVIWVGVEAPPELGVVQSSIEAAVARLGYAREERPFTPHLTLGRVSRNATPADLAKIGKTLEKHTVGFLGATCVKEVCLYRSDLRPSGSVYSRIFAAPLTE